MYYPLLATIVYSIATLSEDILVEVLMEASGYFGWYLVLVIILVILGVGGTVWHGFNKPLPFKRHWLMHPVGTRLGLC